VTGDPVEVIRSEEELVLLPRRRAVERLRVRRVVTTREVVLKVPVRREELVVERLPADGEVEDLPLQDDPDGVRLRMVLRDEVPEVVMRVVPRELVEVHVDRDVQHTAVTTRLAREEVVVDVPDHLAARHITTEPLA
jgi:stress response protein YsnF